MAKDRDQRNEQEPEEDFFNFDELEEVQEIDEIEEVVDFVEDEPVADDPVSPLAADSPPGEPSSRVDLGSDPRQDSSSSMNIDEMSVIEFASLEEEQDATAAAAAPVPSAEEDESISFDPDPIEVASKSELSDLKEDVIDLSEPVAELELQEDLLDLGAEDFVEEDFAALDDPGSPYPAHAVTADATPIASEGDINLLSDEEIVLGGPPVPGESSRDLIAEELESGVDLLGTAAQKAPPADSEDAIDDFLATIGNEDPSSSVDLGSAHSLPTFNMDDFDPSELPPAPTAGGSHTDMDVSMMGAAAADSDDLIDLDPEMTTDAPSYEAMGAVAAGAAAGAAAAAAARNKRSAADEDDLPQDKPVAKGKKKGKADPDAADDNESDAKPSKKDKSKPAKRGGSTLLGMFLGGVLATGACVGAWTFGIEPPSDLREMAGTKTTRPTPLPPPGPGVPPGPGPGIIAPPGPVAPPAVAVAKSLERGELDDIQPEQLSALDEAKPDEITTRARITWLNYVRTQRGKNLQADAEPVKTALADLEKAIAADHADALFLRAQMHQRLGNIAAAKADLEAGLMKFAADAEQKERFQASLDALNLTVAAPAAAGWHPAVLLVFAYQPEPKDGEPTDPPAAQLPPEPAPRFIRALTLAREKKFGEALKALEEARAAHDERRSVLPNKPTSPASDPDQATFLRACDQVKAHLELLAKLHNPDYLVADPPERDALVDALLAKAETAAAATLVKDLGAKLAKDKPVASVADLVKLVEAERADAAAKLKDLDGKLTLAAEEAKSLGEKLKTSQTALTEESKKLTAALDREKALQAETAAALKAFQAIGKTLGAKVDSLKDQDMLMREVAEMKAVADKKDPKGDIRRLEAELAADRATLANRWDPASLLEVWLPVLQTERGRKDLADRALRDAALVEGEAKVTAEQKAQIAALRGLAARNAGQLDQAKTALAAALPELRGTWKSAAETALKDIESPLGDVVGNSQALADAGKLDDALALLAKGIATSAAKGPLFAQRGQIALEAARTRGQLRDDDPLVKQALADAGEAAAAGEADGHFLAGRLAEELGDLDAAVKQYQQALQAHPGLDERGAHYRAALGRVLLKRGNTTATPPRPVPPASRLGKRDIEALQTFVALALIGDALPKEVGAPVSDAEKLADEILALGDKAPFEARAQALAIKGLYTRALKEYTAGLRDNKLLAPRHANELTRYLETHPAFQGVEIKTTPDPLEGERLYAAGLRHYTAKRYAEAQRDFAGAVQNDANDARYLYFLGLSRLMQGDRGGVEDFDRAARLERAGRPDRAAVSTALERVQGPAREMLNAIRNRPVLDHSK
jgi:hypothetical protein